MTEDAIDRNKLQKEAVKAFLETPIDELDLKPTSEFLSAYAIDPIQHPKIALSDLRNPKHIDHLTKVDIKNLSDVLGVISYDLGDAAVLAQTRDHFRSTRADEYNSFIQDTNNLMNEANQTDSNSLTKHVAFLNALSDLLNQGKTIKPAIFRDEIKLLQMLIKERNKSSAEHAASSESASDLENHYFSNAHLIILFEYEAGKSPLPAYVDDETKKKIDTAITLPLNHPQRDELYQEAASALKKLVEEQGMIRHDYEEVHEYSKESAERDSDSSAELFEDSSKDTSARKRPRDKYTGNSDINLLLNFCCYCFCWNVFLKEPAVKEAYTQAIQLIERLHRRFLDVVNIELERLKMNDINNVQALILYNINSDELTIGELTNRGYYLGSNVSYNVKKLVENGYLEQEKAPHDKRSVRIKLSEKGLNLCKKVDDLYQRNVDGLSKETDNNGLQNLNKSLELLERFWTDYINNSYKLK